MYSPPASNVPVLTKKGDAKLAAAYSTNALGGGQVHRVYNYGFDGQVAYAIHNHWMVLLNQSNRYEKTGTTFQSGFGDSSTIRYKRVMTEIGGGYFTTLHDSSNISLQLTGGVGFGKFNLDEAGKDAMNSYYTRFHTTTVTRIFFQPALQLRLHKRFTSSLASRFIVLWYHGIQTNYTAAEQDNYLLDGLSASPRTFWEPSIINNFSLKKLRAIQFELQVGFAALISRRFVDYNGFNMSAGVILDIAKLKKNPD